MSRVFDLAIVGAGPGGASAAITAARAGMQVVLFDRDSFPRPKVCGEFVSAESLDLLVTLLGCEHALLIRSLRISSARLFFGGGVIETHIEPAAASFPRYELDHALWQAAGDAGVDAHSAEAATRITGDGPFVVHTAKGSYVANSVINASGRWSGLLQTVEPPQGPKWIGLKAHYETPDSEESVDLYFFRHGYCGVQPVHPQVVNVCAMVRSDVATRIEEIFERHPALKVRSSGFRRVSDPVATAPLRHDPPCPLAGNVLQVGDAAGFIDPFLGDGISLALQTGARAAKALLAFAQSESSLTQAARSYADAYQRDVLPAFQHADRLRRVLALSQPFQPAVRHLLKVPRVTEWLLKKTRSKVAV